MGCQTLAWGLKVLEPPRLHQKKSFTSLSEHSVVPFPSIPIIFPSVSHKGEPGIKIPKSAIDSMSKPLQYTLVGKFSHGHPSMERSRLIFSKIGLKGASLGHLDPKHMMVRMHDKEDFKCFGCEKFGSLMDFPCAPLDGALSLDWRSNPPSSPYGFPFIIYLCSSSTNKVCFPLGLFWENHLQWMLRLWI